jgi:DNA-binding MarR family transcriptional regulator
MARKTKASKQRDAAERLADIFTILHRNFVTSLSRELSRGNVSFSQYFLLGYLSQTSSLSMTEIATRMGHTTAAATGLVDRLENLGYAKRTHAKDDRRKILVEITSSGRTLVEKVRSDMVSNLLKLMQHLTVEEQTYWLRIYEKIIAVEPIS